VGLLSPVDLEFAQQSQPYFIYEKRFLSKPIERFTWKIDYGFGYLLRRFVCLWPDATFVGTAAMSPTLYAEWFDTGTGKARQVQPIPLDLTSSPNRYGEIQPIVNGLRIGAGLRGSFKILNWFYPYADTIELRITGQDVSGLHHCGVPNPPFVHVLLDGYYVPEKTLDLWHKAGLVESGARQ